MKTMRRMTTAVIGLALSLPATADAQERAAHQDTWDVLIRGGQIVDGTGNPWFDGDVAIVGDRIVEVGKLEGKATARRVLDAKGLIVAPGFIDIHSHSDMPLLEDGRAQSKVRQGVTTEVLGEDSSAGPAKGKREPGRYEGHGQSFTWATLGGYFDVLEKQGIAPNV